MKTERDLIEDFVSSGGYGYSDDRPFVYDPVTHSQEGLDDACFHCGAWPTLGRVEHKADCVWVEGMAYLGHPLPEKHTVAGAVAVTQKGKTQ